MVTNEILNIKNYWYVRIANHFISWCNTTTTSTTYSPGSPTAGYYQQSTALRWFAAPGIFSLIPNNTMRTIENQTNFNPGIEIVTRKFMQGRDLVTTGQRIISMRSVYLQSYYFQQFLTEQERIDFTNDIEQTIQFMVDLFTANPIIPERRTLS